MVKPIFMDVNITIIGSGVIGLAIACHLSSIYDNIFVIEKNKLFGQETSSRNSEVIHSGIYYPEGSLKARMCVRGRELLYQTCKKEGILFNKCGKLIVATENKELVELDILKDKAIKNNVFDLQLLDRKQVLEMDPNISAIKALFSPSTGIVDSHGLMKHFERSSIRNGVNFAYHSKVVGIKKQNNGYQIRLKDADDKPFIYSSSIVINCAGLESDKIAKMVGISDENYSISFCKGEYFRVNPPKNKLVSRLIYPVPMQNLVGLGIHSTIDLSGGLKLGPNAFYLNKNIYDYTVNSSNSLKFYNSAKKFLPFLSPEDLSPDMAGIRPKIQTPGGISKDFIIKNESDKGYNNFINLIGIESPGLTSCMAIAEYVEKIIK